MAANEVGENKILEECIKINIGEIPYVVYMEGKPTGPPLITIHDVFMDHSCCFGLLFSAKNSERILSVYRIYHIVLPGQNRKCAPIQAEYPSASKLAEDIHFLIKEHLKITKVVGVGVGFGAYLLVRCALADNSLFICMMLANFHPSACKFLDYYSWKFFLRELEAPGMGTINFKFRMKVMDYVLGGNSQEAVLIGHPLNYSFSTVENYLSSISDTTNLHKLLGSYLSREEIILLPREQFVSEPEDAPSSDLPPQSCRSLQYICPCLLVTGRNHYYYEHVEDSLVYFGIQKWERLILDGADTVLIDHAEDVMQAFSLFLCGQNLLPGYVLHEPPSEFKKLDSLFV